MLEEYSGDTFYHKIFIPLALVTVVLAWLARPSRDEATTPSFSTFRLSYLTAWCLCVAADWLQAPYVYALYSAYGYNSRQIATLFMAGFCSSMLFSCLVGSMADRWGRKRCCLIYCILYSLTCFSKHYPIFSVLIAGRILSGISTSILFSCFECWMVSEHFQRHHFSGHLLTYMFGVKFSSMYFVAILSGLAAQVCSDAFVLEPIFPGSKFYVGGYTAPFDLAIVCLMIGFGLIALTWEENYGNELPGADAASSFNPQAIIETVEEGLRVLFRTTGAGSLAAVVSGFEAAMYIFVFSWTPALESKTIPPPHGLIFALFMMACMCGSAVSTLLAKQLEPLHRMAAVLCLGIFTFLLASYFVERPGFLFCRCAAFLCFEALVGCYYPAVGILKCEIVPERVRSTVYNIYRIPLNAVVVTFLVSEFSLAQSFRLCAVLLMGSFVGLGSIHAARNRQGKALLSKVPTMSAPASKQQKKLEGASA